MKKKYWIYIVVLVILLIGGGAYFYFYHYSPGQLRIPFLQLNNDQIKSDISAEKKENGQGLKTADEKNNNENRPGTAGNKNDGKISNKDNDESTVKKSKINETNEKKEAKEREVDYLGVGKIAVKKDKRTGFRNPFKDYRRDKKNSSRNVRVSSLINSDKSITIGQDKEQITVEEIKNNLPFKLTGIIGSDDKRLAIIQDKEGSKIKHNGEYIGMFRILNIKKEKVTFVFRGIIFEIGLRSDAGES